MPYDTAIPNLLTSLKAKYGNEMPTQIAIVRDIFGKICCLLPANSKRDLDELTSSVKAGLAEYAAEPAVINLNSSISRKILLEPSLWRVETLPDLTEITVQTVDRRIVGQDWLLPPPSTGLSSPRIVFSSLKGGVGRSTALAVAASHLAQRGRNILVIDFDLEAPGLGSMLLNQDNRPNYGTLDFLVENGRRSFNDEDLDEFVGTSELTDRTAGQGIVDVVPATGRLCMRFPQNVLSKLARAVLEDPKPDGSTETLRQQTRSFVDRMSSRRRYDAVFIDARAGLAELTAAPLLGLNATVLMFGVDQPQTFEGFAYLLAHLAQLPINDGSDWRYNLRFVQSKASANPADRESFINSLYDTLSEHFYEADTDPSQLEVGDKMRFNFSMSDNQAPHHPFFIGFDGRYLNFDPIRDRSFLSEDLYKAAYEPFLKNLEQLVGIKDDNPVFG
ncbi:ParA family protein [Methylorubrum sp. SB2]|uniref:ParA family protein n=1 Tax=Methylorubrum subtropicum TaxID=3138812 RepID=UPI00313E1FB3